MSPAGNQILGKTNNDFNIFSQNNHNPMVNPIPYNIQNPYILKEMTGLKTPSSYLAMKGSQNLKLG